MGAGFVHPATRLDEQWTSDIGPHAPRVSGAQTHHGRNAYACCTGRRDDTIRPLVPPISLFPVYTPAVCSELCLADNPEPSDRGRRINLAPLCGVIWVCA
jgi:hypothetical protein